MNTYTFYGVGIFKNKKFSIQANTKKEAIEKAKKEFNGAVTIRTFRRAK